MDVIFMRNVLIYFAPETKRLILGKVQRQLTGDGTLFLGGAETTLGLNGQFARTLLGKTTLYRPTSMLVWLQTGNIKKTGRFSPIARPTVTR
jgi:chemotaxis methyl-accepting protein methylase